MRPRDERRGGDQRPADDAADDRRPELGAAAARLATLGTTVKASHDDRGDEEAGAEKEVESTAFDGEPRRAQERDQAAGEHEDRREHELQLGERIRVAEASGTRRKSGERRSEQAEEQHLSPEEALEAVIVHFRPYRHNLADGMTERILIVDDHPLTRDALAGLLTQNGFDVVGQAGSGEEAIEQAAGARPDLMLLDLSMPGDGRPDGPAEAARRRAAGRDRRPDRLGGRGQSARLRSAPARLATS